MSHFHVSPGRSRCARQRMIEDEVLIDLSEWTALHGQSDPFEVPSGITAGLWSRIERIPFRLAGRVSVEDRVCEVVERARSCLESSRRQTVGLPHREANARSCTLPFSAFLPCSADDAPRRQLAIYCGPLGSVTQTITIGLREELTPDVPEDARSDTALPTPPN